MVWNLEVQFHRDLSTFIQVFAQKPGRCLCFVPNPMIFIQLQYLCVPMKSKLLYGPLCCNFKRSNNIALLCCTQINPSLPFMLWHIMVDFIFVCYGISWWISYLYAMAYHGKFIKLLYFKTSVHQRRKCLSLPLIPLWFMSQPENPRK